MAFREAKGPDSLEPMDIPLAEIGPHEVLVKVGYCGVNPIDNAVVSGIYKASPIPHIPGVEVVGEVVKAGSQTTFKEGERVINYPRIFCGTCDMCLSAREMLCRNGGIIGLVTQGCYADYSVLPEASVFRVPDSVSDELAVGLPVGALTAYHALKRARLTPGERVLIFGSSGNTGLFLVQLAKLFGAEVIAVTRKEWVKEYGADITISVDMLKEKPDLAGAIDVVVNSLGSKFWEHAIQLLNVAGRLVTFGVLTGEEAKINVGALYRREMEIIGSTGGSRMDFMQLIRLASTGALNTKVWKIFKLDDAPAAIKTLRSEERDGRLHIKP
ncbi:MAG: alcohol dehydrogenase catalytic domain-containing protein [Candidatus Binatia bacterium]